MRRKLCAFACGEQLLDALRGCAMTSRAAARRRATSHLVGREVQTAGRRGSEKRHTKAPVQAAEALGSARIRSRDQHGSTSRACVCGGGGVPGGLLQHVHEVRVDRAGRPSRRGLHLQPRLRRVQRVAGESGDHSRAGAGEHRREQLREIGGGEHEYPRPDMRSSHAPRARGQDSAHPLPSSHFSLRCRQVRRPPSDLSS